MEFYAGLDVSLETTSVCVVDREGKVIREGKLASDPDAIELFLAEPGIHLKRVGLEAFSYSAWLFTAISEKGLAVICIESRHAKAALNAMANKTDRNAKGIVQMMRTGWFRTLHVKSESSQPLRAPLVGRKAMRCKMLGVENMIRGLLSPFGLQVGKISVGRFDARLREIMAGKSALEAIVARCSTPATPYGCSWQNCTACRWQLRAATAHCTG
jgi:transposase